MVEFNPRLLPEAQIPIQLKELPRPTQLLYLCGSLPTQPMVAIVGTRHPSPEAVEFAEDLARGLVGQGFAVVSGGAAGIDAAAHRGALSARGQTLVVAPAGWHNPYPESNRNLFRDIVACGGGYMSLVDPNKRPLSGNFFARNAILVALSKATVVIQAPIRSGARNAAHVARKLLRPLFVVPSAPWVEKGAGCLIELRLGARPIGALRDLLTGLAEVGIHGSRDPLQLELRLQYSDGGTSKSEIDGPTNASYTTDRSDFHMLSDLDPVLQALARGCRSLDSVCQYVGWNLPKVQSALLRLTLSGRIHVTPAGRIEPITT
jgi:DNA processing protein